MNSHLPARRRSNYDVTDTVAVDNPRAVCGAVRLIFRNRFPEADFSRVERAFADYTRLYQGEYPGFHGCETGYHDLQHSLDATLALARVMDGYEQTASPSQQLGPERFVVGIIIALFHDSGYMRELDDRHANHGAQYTVTHVARSGQFIKEYLAQLDLGEYAEDASNVVHFTGYERSFSAIEASDPKLLILGHLLGTADLMAQMADRCYLEKCRDRLYREFELGGLAGSTPRHARAAAYSSPLDLLRRTPGFFYKMREERLDGAFAGAYRYVENHFNGYNPYLITIERSVAHMEDIIAAGAWSQLRRKPPENRATLMTEENPPRHKKFTDS